MTERCIICGNTVLYALYDPGPQPVACLNIHLPTNLEEAKSAPRLPMTYSMCQTCGHVFNTSFDLKAVEYEHGSSTIYNQSPEWVEFMHSRASLLGFRYSGKMVIEIGCGDCVFLEMLSMYSNYSKLNLPEIIGFDPGVTNNPNVITDYFVPERDLKKFTPDLIVCRHVLEHIHNPRDFLQGIYHWCNVYKKSVHLYFEVPCFEKGFEQGRIFDFIYEHVSNYSEESFRTLFESCGFETISIEKGYNDEVLSGIFYLGIKDRGVDTFNEYAHSTIEGLSELDNIVVWGGSGKCASFLNMYNLDHSHVRVVDSDAKKVGRRVPGVGHLIQSPETIQDNETIIIPTIWRARDIYQEIQACGISYKQILLPLKGKLYEYGKTPAEF